MARFPQDIAIKTSQLSTDTLDRVLTEEIVHFLDHHLGFSEKGAFQMQEVANTDANHPLSIGMLAAVRGGTKGLDNIDDVFNESSGIATVATTTSMLATNFESVSV